MPPTRNHCRRLCQRLFEGLLLTALRLCALQQTWHSWGHQDGFVWASGLSRDDFYSLVEVCHPPCLPGYRPTHFAHDRLSSPSVLRCGHVCQADRTSRLTLATCWLQAASEVSLAHACCSARISRWHREEMAPHPTGCSR